MEEHNGSATSEDELCATGKETSEPVNKSAERMDETASTEESNHSLVISEDTDKKIVEESCHTSESQQITEEGNEPSTSGDSISKEEEGTDETKGECDEDVTEGQGIDSTTEQRATTCSSAQPTESNCNGGDVTSKDLNFEDLITEDLSALIEDFTLSDPLRTEDPEARAIREANMKRTCTPLMSAAGKGRRDWIKALLAKGCNVHDTDSEGNTALHFAARWGHDACVKMLQGNGARPSARNTQGHTPLHYATRWRHHKVIDLLVRAGANPSTCDGSGRTPLHWAAACNHCEIIQIFLRRGADRRVRSAEGHTAEDLAAMFGHAEASTFLREEFPSIQDFLEANGNAGESAKKSRRKKKQKPKAINEAAMSIIQQLSALLCQVDSVTSVNDDKVTSLDNNENTAV